MGSAISSVNNQVSNIVRNVSFASGGDYRLALVSFDDNIYVNEQFALTNWAS